MNRPALLCVLAAVAVAVLARANAADASTTGLELSPSKSSSLTKPLQSGWRGFKTEGGGFQLTYSPEGPGPSALTLSCRPPVSTVDIQAPAVPGTSASSAIRLTSGGFVRVFFAKQSLETSDATILTHAPVSDEMLQMFRKTGRIVAGRASLFARSQAEKAVVEDFFAGCAPGSVAKP
jgi:hypothetical protein